MKRCAPVWRTWETHELPNRKPQFGNAGGLCRRRTRSGNRRALEQHLAGCAACRSMAADQSRCVEGSGRLGSAPGLARFQPAPVWPDRPGSALSWWERLTRPFRPMPLRQALPLTATAGLLLMAGLLLQHPVSFARRRAATPNRARRSGGKHTGRSRFVAPVRRGKLPRKACIPMPCSFDAPGFFGSDLLFCWRPRPPGRPSRSRSRISPPRSSFWRTPSTAGTACPPRSANASSPSCRPPARG
jgi:hypothetical protein